MVFKGAKPLAALAFAGVVLYGADRFGPHYSEPTQYGVVNDGVYLFEFADEKTFTRRTVSRSFSLTTMGMYPDGELQLMYIQGVDAHPHDGVVSFDEIFSTGFGCTTAPGFSNECTPEEIDRLKGTLETVLDEYCDSIGYDRCADLGFPLDTDR